MGEAPIRPHPPIRLLLDTSVLQWLHDFGEFIFDGGSIPESSPLWIRADGAEQLDALRQIMFVGQRLSFQFCVSDSVLREVDAGESASRLMWALEMLDHWLDMTAHDVIAPHERTLDAGLSFLSVGDQAVLQDAMNHSCPIVLTVDARLARGCRNRRNLGLEVLQPADYWIRLRPWAALYV